MISTTYDKVHQPFSLCAYHSTNICFCDTCIEDQLLGNICAKNHGRWLTMWGNAPLKTNFGSNFFSPVLWTPYTTMPGSYVLFNSLLFFPPIHFIPYNSIFTIIEFQNFKAWYVAILEGFRVVVRISTRCQSLVTISLLSCRCFKAVLLVGIYPLRGPISMHYGRWGLKEHICRKSWCEVDFSDTSFVLFRNPKCIMSSAWQFLL